MSVVLYNILQPDREDLPCLCQQRDDHAATVRSVPSHVRTIGSRVGVLTNLPAMCNQDVASDTLLAVLEQLAVFPSSSTPLTGRVAQLGLWSSVRRAVLWLRAYPCGWYQERVPQSSAREEVGRHQWQWECVTSFSFGHARLCAFRHPSRSAALPAARRLPSTLPLQYTPEPRSLTAGAASLPPRAEPIVLTCLPSLSFQTPPHPHPRRCQIPWDVRAPRLWRLEGDDDHAVLSPLPQVPLSPPPPSPRARAYCHRHRHRLLTVPHLTLTLTPSLSSPPRPPPPHSLPPPRSHDDHAGRARHDGVLCVRSPRSSLRSATGAQHQTQQLAARLVGLSRLHARRLPHLHPNPQPTRPSTRPPHPGVHGGARLLTSEPIASDPRPR